MLHLLSPNRHRTSLSPASQNEDAANEAHATLQSLLDRGVEPHIEEIPENIVYIDLLPDHLPSSLIDSGGEATSWMSTNEAIAEERFWAEHGHQIERASRFPRHLRDIDPTITLPSSQDISAQSHFSVHTDDGIVFSETTTLEALDPTSAPTANGRRLYKTTLVPGFWDTISRSPGKLDHPHTLANGY